MIWERKIKKQNCDRLIEKDYLQQMVDSKLKEVEKEEIRIYIDTNIGLLAYRFCPYATRIFLIGCKISRQVF